MTQFTDDLLLLEELRRAGSLTPEEFTLAKAKLLTGSADVGAVQAQAQLAAQTDIKLRRLELQSELLHVEREWDDVGETLMLRGKYGRRTVPTHGGATLIAIIGIVCILPFVLISFVSRVGATLPILMGLGLTAFCLALASHMGKAATKYKEAEAEYCARKAELQAKLAALEPPPVPLVYNPVL